MKPAIDSQPLQPTPIHFDLKEYFYQIETVISRQRLMQDLNLVDTK